MDRAVKGSGRDGMMDRNAASNKAILALCSVTVMSLGVDSGLIGVSDVPGAKIHEARAEHAVSRQLRLPSEDPDRWLLGFLDVETTGLMPGHHEMVDIGLVLTDLEGVEVARFFRRIMPPNPERLSPEAAAMNGFSVERWGKLGAVSVGQAVKEIERFLRETPKQRNVLLVAYNVAFDAAFIDHLFRQAGRDWREIEEVVSYHKLDLPSMAWSLGYRQLHGDIGSAVGVPPETEDPLEHTGLTGAEFNVELYRALLQRSLSRLRSP